MWRHGATSPAKSILLVFLIACTIRTVWRGANVILRPSTWVPQCLIRPRDHTRVDFRRNAKILYVKTPKTGGTSIRLALQEIALQLGRVPLDKAMGVEFGRTLSYINDSYDPYSHDLLSNHLYPSEELYRFYVPVPTFNMTSLRSPLPRAVSFYTQKFRNMSTISRDDRKCSESQSFLNSTVDGFLQRYKDQYSWVSMGDGSVLDPVVPDPATVLSKYDFIFISEMMTASASCFADIVNIGPRKLDIGHVNVRASSCVKDAFLASNRLKRVFERDSDLYQLALEKFANTCMPDRREQENT